MPVNNQLTIAHEAGVSFVEPPPDSKLMRKPDDVNLVIEACFSSHSKSALLYASNMSPRFFDLSSGEAGVILQKLRQYGIRAALVCLPGQVQFSSRFGELMIEENRSNYFRFFESAEPARQWLVSA
jgi:hypothetical protein